MEAAEMERAKKGALKCMMNGVIYYPGIEDVLEAEALREMVAEARATKITEDDFDDLGHPRLKIVYIDVGYRFSETPSKAELEVEEHMMTIIDAEKRKEKREGRRRPRLIFVGQDRDFWPGSEQDPDVMARRAAKEKAAYPLKADYKEITVARLPEEENLVLPPFFADAAAEQAYLEERSRLNFMRHFDPSKPGTKFILDNITTAERDSVLDEYKKDPDLWKQWLRISGQLDTTPAVTEYSNNSQVSKRLCTRAQVSCTWPASTPAN